MVLVYVRYRVDVIDVGAGGQQIFYEPGVIVVTSCMQRCPPILEKPQAGKSKMYLECEKAVRYLRISIDVSFVFQQKCRNL